MLSEGRREDRKLLLETEFTDCYSAVNPLVSILKTSPDTEEPRSLGNLSLDDSCRPGYFISQDSGPGPGSQDEEDIGSVPPTSDKTCSRPSLSLPKFADPFDAYLYQSYHITTPVITPTLIFPTEDQPSYISGNLPSNLPEPFCRRASHKSEQLSPKNSNDVAGENVETGRGTLLHVPIARSRNRGVSLPDNLYSREFYRLRNFSLFGNKVINNGDLIRSISSSCNSNESSAEDLLIRTKTPEKVSSAGDSRIFNGLQQRSPKARGQNEDPGDSPPQDYKVLLLGASGVGKSSLCCQFLSSENVNTYEPESLARPEKCVVMAVNGELSNICFVDQPHGCYEIDVLLERHNPDAVVVVMAVDDFSSYLLAQSIIEKLSRVMMLERNPIILVANKADMVRNRKVKARLGKELATVYNIKYIETSSGINHNIDELLVGIHTQIQLRSKSDKKSFSRRRNSSLTKRVGSFLGSLMTRSSSQAKSCSNLSVI